MHYFLPARTISIESATEALRAHRVTGGIIANYSLLRERLLMDMND